MKVFVCKRNRNYGGGLIVVAANTLEEAYETYYNNNAYKYMHDRDWEGNLITDFYPKPQWFEEVELSANCNEPKILLEDGFSE